MARPWHVLLVRAKQTQTSGWLVAPVAPRISEPQATNATGRFSHEDLQCCSPFLKPGSFDHLTCLCTRDGTSRGNAFIRALIAVAVIAFSAHKDADPEPFRLVYSSDFVSGDWDARGSEARGHGWSMGL